MTSDSERAAQLHTEQRPQLISYVVLPRRRAGADGAIQSLLAQTDQLVQLDHLGFGPSGPAKQEFEENE